MEDLKDIIKEILKYDTELGLKCNSDMILDCSTRIFISNMINNQKRENIKEFKEAKNYEPVTKKQAWLLENKIGVSKDLIMNMSKMEATKIIDEYFKELDKKKETPGFQANEEIKEEEF